MNPDDVAVGELPRRGRRRRRPSGEDRRRAILATAEQLLGERSPDLITVDDLARGAGISRPSFYFHFASKDEVLLALLDRVIAETDAGIARVEEDTSADPREVFMRSIAVFVEVFSAHRTVTSVVYARAGNDEVARLWAAALERWVDSVATRIEAERARGRVTTPIPSRELATALLLANERILVGAFADHGPAVPTGSLTEVLRRMWLAGIYADPDGG